MKHFINSVSTLSRGFKLFFIFLFTVSIVFQVFQSCNRGEIYETKEDLNTNANLLKFKESIKINGTKIKNKLTTSRVGITSAEMIIFEESIRPDALNLIRSYGFTDQEIINEFGSLDSPDISVTAELILQTEELIDNGQTLDILEPDDFYYFTFMNVIGINSAYAQSDTVGGCLMDAAGIYALADLAQGNLKKLGKKGAMKLARKVLSKALGPIGGAMAAWDFADCMGWI